MSLMKNNNNSSSVGIKKSLNLTAQVNDAIMSYNQRSGWKSRTSKLVKTLTNQVQNPHSNLMTQQDIDKLFGRCSTGIQNPILPTKISTEITDIYGGFGYRNFIKSVKFLHMDDDYDKFLTGIPDHSPDSPTVNQLSPNDQDKIDLTSQFKKVYLVGKIIGQGAYASVRVAIYKPQDKKIAIKIYQKNKIKQLQKKKSVRRQIKILALLHHPNIVKILDVVQTNNHLNIVMEYLPGTSLGSYLKTQPTGKIQQKSCKKIFRSLAKALAYMHTLSIAHRDIKLQNIILDDDLNPKIIDFGFSTCIQPDKKIKIFCGTPSYMAPEVVQRKQYRGQAADIWALGVMLFVCLTGIFPFKGATDQQLYKKINNSQYPKTQLQYSRTLLDLFSRLLKINPQQRITANEVLKHPWFNQLKNDSSRKKNIDNSLENRKRVNTTNSNISKESRWGHKTGLIKKALIDTINQQNLQLDLKIPQNHPRIKKEINSYRLVEKQNIIKYLKSEKNTFRKKEITEKQFQKKQKYHKIQKNIINLLKLQMKKIQLDQFKNQKKYFNYTNHL